MESSVIDNIKLKQCPVDTWTTREHLCLSSAVSQSGEQNWVAVSRSIRQLTTETDRPPDWYSTKNCAVQYAKLLEDVDPPKRKREKGEGGPVETTGQIVTKTISKKRVEELKGILEEEKATYFQLRRELLHLESNQLDNRLHQFWDEIMREQETEEEEAAKLKQFYEDREQKIKLFQANTKMHALKGLSSAAKSCSIASDAGPSAATSSSQIQHQEQSTKKQKTSGSNAELDGIKKEEIDESIDCGPSIVGPVGVSLPRGPCVGSSQGGGSALPRGPCGGSSQGGGGALPSASPSAPSPHKATPNSATSSSSASAIFSPRENEDEIKVDSSVYEDAKDFRPERKEERNLKPHIEDSLDEVKCDTSFESTMPLDYTSNLNVDMKDHHDISHEEEAKKLEDVSDEKNVVEDREKMEEEEKEEEIKKEKGEGEGEEEEEIEEDEETEAEINNDRNETKDDKEEEEREREAVEEEEKKRGQEKEEEEVRVREEEDRERERKEGGERMVEEVKEVKKEGKKRGRKRKRPLKDEVKLSAALLPSSSSSSSFLDTFSTPKRDEEEFPRMTDEDSSMEGDGGGMMPSSSRKTSSSTSLLHPHHADTSLLLSSSLSSFSLPLSSSSTSLVGGGGGGLLLSSSTSSFLHLEEQTAAKKKDEYEFEDDASRDSTDVKEYTACRGDRRNKSCSSSLSLLSCSSSLSVCASALPSPCAVAADGGVASPVVSESTPSSPASTNYGDDPESEKIHRSWKRSIMLIWNDIAAHKNASIFLKPITEEKVPGYHSVVFRPIDLMTIKRSIENGTIRTTPDFQHSVMLMFLNAKMYNTSEHNVYRMADHMMNDALHNIEGFISTQMLAKVVETPQKTLRRETRESSAKRVGEDKKRKRDTDREEKTVKRRKL